MTDSTLPPRRVQVFETRPESSPRVPSRGWHQFHPSATLHHALMTTDEGQIYVLRPVRPTAPVADFLRRWAPELAAYTDNVLPVPITPQLLCALALAQSGGQTDFYSYIRHHRLSLFKDIPQHFFSGDPRDVYGLHGLFAIPLPMARAIRNDPEFSAAELRMPGTSFALIVHWIAVFAVKFFEEHREFPGPLDIALHVHGSNLIYERRNPYRVPYRGNFLPDFLGYYNTASLLIHQQESAHAPQERSPDHRGSDELANPGQKSDRQEQAAPGNAR